MKKHILQILGVIAGGFLLAYVAEAVPKYKIDSSSDMSAPPAIGATTPSTGKFTSGTFDFIGVDHMSLSGMLSATAIRVNTLTQESNAGSSASFVSATHTSDYVTNLNARYLYTEKGIAGAGDLYGFIGSGQTSLVKSGPSGYVLTSQGTGSMPAWKAATGGGGGDLTSPGPIGSVTPDTGKFTSLESSTGLTVDTGGIVSKDTVAAGGSGIVGYADSGAAISNADRLGYYFFGGAKDNAHSMDNSAGMSAYATQNWSGSAAGTQLQFEVTPNNSTTRSTAMTLDQDGTASFYGAIKDSNGSDLSKGIISANGDIFVLATSMQEQHGIDKLLMTEGFVGDFQGSNTLNPYDTLNSTGAYYDSTNKKYTNTTTGDIDSNAKLLLHCDGSNGGTTFTDSGGGANNPYTVTATNATTSTTHIKYGSAACSFNGSSSYLTVPNNSDWEFGSGDFTIDFWLYLNSNSGTPHILLRDYDVAGSNPRWVIDIESGSLHFYAAATTPWDYGSINMGAVNASQWYHVAIVRNGNTVTGYKDGVATGTPISNSAGIQSSSGRLGVGAENGTNFTDGYIDELRISKGVARWTANFTPPTGAYAAGGNSDMDWRTKSFAVSSNPTSIYFFTIDKQTTGAPTYYFSCAGSGSTSWIAVVPTLVTTMSDGRTVRRWTGPTSCSGSDIRARVVATSANDYSIYAIGEQSR